MQHDLCGQRKRNHVFWAFANPEQVSADQCTHLLGCVWKQAPRASHVFPKFLFLGEDFVWTAFGARPEHFRAALLFEGWHWNHCGVLVEKNSLCASVCVLCLFKCCGVYIRKSNPSIYNPDTIIAVGRAHYKSGCRDSPSSFTNAKKSCTDSTFRAKNVCGCCCNRCTASSVNCGLHPCSHLLYSQLTPNIPSQSIPRSLNAFADSK